MSWQSTGNDNEIDDESTTINKPQLDPQAVIALALSIPNCSQVSPPNNNNTTTGSSTTRSNNINPTGSGISESSSYFSQFSRHLQHTFSNESVVVENKNKQNKGGGLKDQHQKILSFLVSDALSIERLAAEAEGKHGSTSELEGAGIARIDVYCNSGTVCTCRVIQTAANDTTELEGGIDGMSAVPPDNYSLPTPRKGNRSSTTTTTSQQKVKDDSIIQVGTQVRRIIRRKCTLEALRKILEQPPKLPEINTSITSNADNNYNDDNDDDDDSQASTVSKKLRKRQLKRHMKKQSNKFTNLSKAQQKFLNAQQKKYEKRIRRDERVRQRVGNAILAGGLDGSSMIPIDEPTGGGLGLDILSYMSLSESQSADTMAAAVTKESEEEGISYVGNDAYNAQLVVQEKIELADMGLAILMGEAQRLERIMSAMEGDGEDTKKNKKTKNKNRCTGMNYDTDRSTSTYQSTDGDYDSEAGSSSDDDDDDDDDESDDDEHKLARIMQGCEVEYSFPSEHHEELESALLGDDMSSSSSENDDSDESSISKVTRNRRRGRSPPRDGFSIKKNASTSNRHNDDYDTISPIKAIPTNGEGCVVLRENGAFDVIGTIPDVLHKKLFRRNGPLPDHISLGTLGRYYVHFEDGSFFL